MIEGNLQTTLVIGYGNPDRQDDGVAWHILMRLAGRWGRTVVSEAEELCLPSPLQPDLLFTLQLHPELAEIISRFQRVAFVDAHTGSLPEDLHFSEIQPRFQASPFTHHMTAETCLSIAETLYGNRPEAVLVSVKGYLFGFEQSLSEKTEALAQTAVERIAVWVETQLKNEP